MEALGVDVFGLVVQAYLALQALRNVLFVSSGRDGSFDHIRLLLFNRSVVGGGNLRLRVLLFLLVAGLAAVAPATIDEDVLASIAGLDGEVCLAGSIPTGEVLTGSEGRLIQLMVALVAGHEVEGLLAEVALPSDALVTSVGRKTLGLLTLFAYDVAAVEAAAARTDGAHAILDEVHETGALEAEEVVEFVRALLALDVFEEPERELVTEHEEVSAAVGALDEGRLRSH